MNNRIVVAMVLVLAALAASCSSQGNVFSLKVGDCFQQFDGTEITDVDIVDCAQPHDHEVFAVYEVNTSTLPSEETFTQGCVDRFEDAIGIPYEQSEIFVTSIFPSPDSFDAGDREVICYTFELDSNLEIDPVRGSVLGSGR